MLLIKDREMLISCWLCPAQLADRAAYHRHLQEKHPGPCGRCGRVHSSECDVEGKTVANQASSGVH